MTEFAKLHCVAAQALITNGHYADAIANLRAALKGTSNRKAWSKIMLAIRELSRIAPQATS